jgi:hypothetical protein
MSHLLLGKRERIVALVVITITLGNLLYPTKTFAESITPIFTEVSQNIGDISNHTIEIDNEYNYDIYITPTVYKYYPKSEYILELQPFEEFVKIDTDSILIPAKKSKNITFQVRGSESLEPGTYYNLIVFNQQLDNKKSDNTLIGATGSLSHLVSLNITETESLEKITEDYDIDIQVVKKGIPFLKPAILKLSFFNNSKYTLIPKGEIQVVKKDADKEPEYIKINLDRDRVYPEDSYEKEYEVKNWYIDDIFFGKTAYLKLQNGIDSGISTKEITIPGFKNEFIYIVITLIVISALVKSIKGDVKPDSKSSQ